MQETQQYMNVINKQVYKSFSCTTYQDELNSKPPKEAQNLIVDQLPSVHYSQVLLPSGIFQMPQHHPQTSLHLKETTRGH